MTELDSLIVALFIGLTSLKIIFTSLWVLGAIFYLVVPLWIRSQQTLEASPQILPIHLDDHDWPADIDELFKDSTDKLSQCGFEVLQAAFLPSATPLIKTSLILLVNRAEKDSAMITAMCSTPESGAGIKNYYVEFSTRFEDESVYDTMNTGELPAFPKPASYTRSQLVDVKQPDELYNIHQSILQRDNRQVSQKVLRLDRDFGGDAIAFLQSAMQEEYESAANYGYLALSPDGQHYLMTIKGAYLMVWGQLWPFKPIRNYLRDWKAARLIRSLC